MLVFSNVGVLLVILLGPLWLGWEKRDVDLLVELSVGFRKAALLLEEVKRLVLASENEKALTVLSKALGALNSIPDAKERFGVPLKPPPGLAEFPVTFGPGIRAFVSKSMEVAHRVDSVILVEIEAAQEINKWEWRSNYQIQHRGRKIKKEMGKERKGCWYPWIVDKTFDGYFRYRCMIKKVYSKGSRFLKFSLGRFREGMRGEEKDDLEPGKSIWIRGFREKFLEGGSDIEVGKLYWIVISPPCGTDLLPALLGVQGDSWIKYVEPVFLNAVKNVVVKGQEGKAQMVKVIKKRKEAVEKLKHCINNLHCGFSDTALEDIEEFDSILSQIWKDMNLLCKHVGLPGVLPSFPRSFDEPVFDYLRKYPEVALGKATLVRGKVLRIFQISPSGPKSSPRFVPSMYYGLRVRIQNIYRVEGLAGPRKGENKKERYQEEMVEENQSLFLIFTGWSDRQPFFLSLRKGREYWFSLSRFVQLRNGENRCPEGNGTKVSKILFACPVEGGV